MGQASSATRWAVAGLAAAVASLGVFVGTGVAHAADTDYLFYGGASGAEVHSPSSADSPWTDGAAGVYGGPQVQKNSDTQQRAGQPGVISVGAAATNAQITPITGGWQVVSAAKSKRVNLLNGLVTATSVTTRTAVSEVAGKLVTHVTTTFGGLKIPGTPLPATIPANYEIKRGKADILLNVKSSDVQDGTAEATGTGIRLILLKPAGKYPAGTVVSVSAVIAIVGPAGGPSTGHTNAGQAYATRVTATHGRLVHIKSAPTAPVTVFPAGTAGHIVTNSLAKILLGQGLDLGAATDTGFGQNTTSGATTHTTSAVANINLFDGLIKANRVMADASASSEGTASGATQVVNLTIGGEPINLNAAPNTIINVLHLGQVTLNQQIATAHGITVRAMDIVMNTARNGLPVGAEVQIGVAQAAAT